jgi:hypothetical protein
MGSGAKSLWDLAFFIFKHSQVGVFLGVSTRNRISDNDGNSGDWTNY